MRRNTKRILFCIVLCLVLIRISMLLWNYDHTKAYILLNWITLICFYPQASNSFNWLVRTDDENSYIEAYNKRKDKT